MPVLYPRLHFRAVCPTDISQKMEQIRRIPRSAVDQSIPGFSDVLSQHSFLGLGYTELGQFNRGVYHSVIFYKKTQGEKLDLRSLSLFLFFHVYYHHLYPITSASIIITFLSRGFLPVTSSSCEA